MRLDRALGASTPRGVALRYTARYSLGPTGWPPRASTVSHRIGQLPPPLLRYPTIRHPTHQNADLERYGCMEHNTPLLIRLIWAIALPCLLVSCGEELATDETDPALLNLAVETVRDVEILYSDSAQVKVRITGPTMLSNLDRTQPYQEFIDGVFVEFYDETGLITSTLAANYAIRYERKGEVITRDSVVWSSYDFQKLETEELIWNEREENIYTDKFAIITTPTQQIRGHGFRAKQDFSNARIQQVEGIVAIEEQQ
ncbi:MAG: LPS export ABC transporter periplasmic protein LptC [Bacteroidota bacterium]